MNLIRKYIDIMLLRIVRWILIGLHVWRCEHISRQDNNKLWFFAGSLEQIIKRIKANYKGYMK